MNTDFAVCLVSPYVRAVDGEFIGVFVGRQLEFQFIESGPWSLFNTQTARKHTIECNRPPHIELGVNVESYEETIRRTLQSIASYPFRVTPNVESSSLPALMSIQCPSLDSVSMIRIHCSCFLPNLKASSSPDIQAFLYHTSVFEKETSHALEGILIPRSRRPQSLTKQYNAVADSLLFQEGMILPCEVENDGGNSNGVCFLVRDLGDSRFVCEIILDRPTHVCPGTNLMRNVVYKVPKCTQELAFASNVATIEQILT